MSKAAAKKKTWRACKGVNKRTGRVKKGFRVKRGGCPVAVAGKTSRRKASRVSAATYHSGGSGYAAGIEAAKRRAAMEAAYHSGGSGYAAGAAAYRARASAKKKR